MDIQALWVGPRLSRVERLALRSFVACGHAVRLHVYEDVAGVPPGVQTVDATRLLPRDQIFVARRGSLALFSDRFRHELLYREGGVWVDLDVVCLRPFDFAAPWVFGLESPGLVGTAVLGGPAGHVLFRHLADLCADPTHPVPWDTRRERISKAVRRLVGRRDPAKARWGESGGPKGVTRALGHAGLLPLALPTAAFMPIPFRRWDTVFADGSASLRETLADSHAIHLWNDMMRRAGLDKEAPFAPTSLAAALEREVDARLAGARP